MGFKINRVRCVSVEERAAYVGALRRLPESLTNCLMLLSPRRAPAEGGAGYNSGRRRDRRDCGANFGRMMPAQQEACARAWIDYTGGEFPFARALSSCSTLVMR
jgi:hypothetical protein